MMLRIKRVPTVVSNYQKDEAEEGARRVEGCGRNCLNQCCIPGAKFPLYAFKKRNVNNGDTGVPGHDKREPPVAFLDSLLLGQWEDRMQRGLFRYDVTACETKVYSLTFPQFCSFCKWEFEFELRNNVYVLYTYLAYGDQFL